MSGGKRAAREAGMGFCAKAAIWLWWRGAWLGRFAIFQYIWVVLIVGTLQGQEPHATGLRWLLIMLDLIACTGAAWVISGLPMYLMARRAAMGRRAHPVPTTARISLPGLLRLSR